jgi:hypothetical protein
MAQIELIKFTKVGEINYGADFGPQSIIRKEKCSGLTDCMFSSFRTNFKSGPKMGLKIGFKLDLFSN